MDLLGQPYVERGVGVLYMVMPEQLELVCNIGNVFVNTQSLYISAIRQCFDLHICDA